MDLRPGMTKQGLRDLNLLYPKKKKLRTGEAQPGEAGAVPAPAAPLVADPGPVPPRPLP